MKTLNIFLIAVILFTFSSCGTYPDLENGLYAEFNTTQGKFVAQLYYKDAPMTVANFVSLAEGNNPMVKKKFKEKKFYNGLTFHRIIDGFMIQGGDPDGTGKGGPGYKFPDEISDSLGHDSKGILSMANSGPNTNGSQFYITLAPQKKLNGHYSVFGEIVKGQKVVDSIGEVKTETRDKPTKDVVMNEVNIIRKGGDAKNFDAVQTFKSEVKQRETELAEKKAKAEKARQAMAAKIDSQINDMAEGFKKTNSGLRYKITEKNKSGKKPVPGQQVKVHYTGKLPSGKVFDSSRKRGKPISFPIGTGKVIAGWDEGIQLLKTGEKARFIIPPSLGYGQRSVGPIPANSALIFDVELISVGK
jgi:peptidylprolyl isomerase